MIRGAVDILGITLERIPGARETALVKLFDAEALRLAGQYAQHWILDGKGARPGPGGSVIVPARLTRIGILDYRSGDGELVRMHRTESEVFAPESLESLKGATLTRKHPSEEVDPKNWRDVAIGHVGDNVRREGEYVVADLYIADADAIADFERGELRELSCGYRAQLTESSHPDADYDQTVIRYNHVGMGPANWGRAGPEVRVLTDSREEQIEQKGTQKMKIFVDGKEYEKGSPEHLAALEARDARISKELKDAQDAASPAAVKLAAAKRAKVLLGVRGVLKDSTPENLEDMDETAAMIQAIRSVVPDFPESASPEYIAGAFAVVQRMAAARDAEAAKTPETPAAPATPAAPTAPERMADGRQFTLPAAGGKPGEAPTTISDGSDEAEQARIKMIEDLNKRPA